MQWYTPCAPLCPRHARAHPVPHLRAGSAPVRAVGARHARVCPVLHLCAIGTSSYVGKTHVSVVFSLWSRTNHYVNRFTLFPPSLFRTHVGLCSGSASRFMGWTRTFQPCPAPVCGERFALDGRDTHVSALSRTCVRGQHRYAAGPSQGLPDSSLADRAGREPSCVAAVRDVDCPPDLAHSRWASSFPLPPSPLSQTSFHTHTQHLHFPPHIQHASPHTLHTRHVPHTHPARTHTHKHTRPSARPSDARSQTCCNT